MRITAKAVDLSAILGDPARLAGLKNRIDKIGIELEGGWTHLPRGVQLTHDGSVRFAPLPLSAREAELYGMISVGTNPPGMTSLQRDTEYLRLSSERNNSIPHHMGEYPSVAMEPHQWESWLRASYPTHVNRTCGMHVHLSFSRGKKKVQDLLTYQRLMDPSYTATVVAELYKWAIDSEAFPMDHHIWNRLEGSNEYCQFLFHADAQAKETRKVYSHEGPHRYTAINYCWAMHETLECRLLPMMDTADLAVSAIKCFLNLTNAFLVVARKKEKPTEIMIPVDDDRFSDTTYITI